MQNAKYQDMPCISSHWLKDMLDSPKTCYGRHLDPQRPMQSPTASLKLGSLVHCLTLTPLQFGEEFILSDYERRSKAGKARYEKLAETGLMVVKPKEFEHAQAIVAALKAHPEARRLLTGGKKEKMILQERERGLLPLKARLDIHHEQQQQVVELKTIYNMESIEKAVDQYRYPLSAAFYADISQSPSVQFIFVQTDEPYEVTVFEMPRLQLQEGREQYQYALKWFDDCWLKKEWPEAEPVVTEDDDPLMIDFMPPKAAAQQRCELPVGELAL